MTSRGVSRPMAEHQMHGHGEMPMDRKQRLEMLEKHYRQTLWVYWTLVLLGVWLLFAPSTLGYATASAQPSGGREVWLSLEARRLAIIFNDLFCGVLLIVFGWRALLPNRPISLWACCFVGIWLNFAPLVFWSPSAAAYLNDTLVGVLVIALAILIPGMPNMIMYMKMGPQIPPGWTYNPSSWPQRWIMIVLGLAGWMVSRHLAGFQLGYSATVWEPFFGQQSHLVLNSNMSHAWPVSDAALGAFAYTFEFLMGWMGSPARWRTMPWMVTFFGILVIPLGLVHIFLVISQPVVVGAWCTMCLLAAAIMLPMIPLEIDEVIAMGQFLVHARRKGQSLWMAFWKGGTVEGGAMDEDSPQLMEFPRHPKKVFLASIRGMTFPWTLVICCVLGLWLMIQPAVFGTARPAASAAHLGGALIITVSVIAMGEVARATRYLNVVLGLAVAVLPWILGGAPWGARISALCAGLIVAGLSFLRGRKEEEYGLWDDKVV